MCKTVYQLDLYCWGSVAWPMSVVSSFRGMFPECECGEKERRGRWEGLVGGEGEKLLLLLNYSFLGYQLRRWYLHGFLEHSHKEVAVVGNMVKIVVEMATLSMFTTSMSRNSKTKYVKTCSTP